LSAAEARQKEEEKFIRSTTSKEEELDAIKQIKKIKDE
jgi:hypothetical protein